MLAQRLPLLWVFAGGCLSGALLLSWWHEDAASHRAAVKQRDVEPPAEVDAPSALAPSARDKEDVAAEPAEAPHAEPAVAPAVDHGHEATAAVAPSPKDDRERADVDAGPATEGGSSVADVLAQLEAAYRQGLPPAPPPAPSTPAAAPAVAATPAPSVTATAPVVAAAAAPAAPQPAAAPVAAAPVIAYVPPVIVAAPVAAPAAAPVAVTPSPAPPSAGNAPVSLPSNISIGNLHQGNLYQVQQQLALMQYMQYVLPYGGYGAPGYGAPGYAPSPFAGGRHPPQPRVPYPSTLTSPENLGTFGTPSALWNVR